MLKEKFETLCRSFSQDEELISKLWEEIKTFHTKENRYYHTLQHLEHIYKELEVFELIPYLEFAIFYHDIIYDTSCNNNEEQSALLCTKRLLQLNVPTALIKKVILLIHETKTHKASSITNALFLDADLAILGAKNYKAYIIGVQKEYAIYDTATYFRGRKEFLKSFLEKEKIYMTKHFHTKYDKKARVNMLIEYNSLT